MEFSKYNVLSGVLGLTIGDAFGVPVEFCNRDLLDKNPVYCMRAFGTHNQPKGTWSDDTSMTLATMDAMTSGLRYRNVMEKFVDWMIDGKYTASGKVFDIGATTAQAISAYITCTPALLCGPTDIMSNGNGSLMRMLPMIYYSYYICGETLNENIIDKIYKMSQLTHGHDISKRCCELYVKLGVKILSHPDKSLKSHINDIIVEEPLFAEVINLSRNEIRSTGYVVDSLGAALWCLYNTDCYSDAVLKAVNLGNDTDTIGAITGSLAGLYYGFSSDGIPNAWIDELLNLDFIKEICNKFYVNRNKW